MTVFTHRHPEEIADAIAELIEQAAAAGVTLRFDAEETTKLGLSPGPCIALDDPVEPDVELAVALGGDGTILRALQHYAGTGVPVFGINYGEIGFLTTVEHDDLSGGVGRALRGEFELLRLPAIAVELPDGGPLAAMNDLAITRKVGDRVAELSYSLDGEEAGRVRCDGLVVATPEATTRAHFVKDLGTLAQLPGTSFYRRLREKFGRLAS
jgi:NAD+ kinase